MPPETDSVFGEPAGSVDFDAVLQTAEDVFDAAETAGDRLTEGSIEVDLTGSVGDAATDAEGDASGAGDDDAGGLEVQPGAEEEDSAAEPQDGGDGGGGDGDTATGEPDGSDGSAAEQELYFANQQVAERSYREAQEALNKERWQRQQVELRLQALEDRGAEAPEPMVNPQEDPVAAHAQLLEAGDYATANQIVAEVQSAANNLAALAQMAGENGDEAGMQLHSQRAQNATQLAEALRWEAQQSMYQSRIDEQLEPLHAARFQTDLNTAAAQAFRAPEFEGVQPTQEQWSQIGQMVHSDERFLGDGSVQAMTNGWRVAAQHVLFGGQQGMIDHLVSQKVQAEVQKALGNRQPAGQARPKQATRAAASTGRSAPTRQRRLTQEEEEAADMQDFETTIPGRSEGLGVLFNR